MKKQHISRRLKKMSNRLFFCHRFLFFIGMAILVVGCAKMGAPDGGWYDETPPVVLGSVPTDKSPNVNEKKIAIYFDEFIKLDNPTEKVVVSPPQINAPEFKVQGKRIVVELKDSLKANTTYTVDFSDAITDNNEGNPLGNYTYSFSTGNQIDTMEVSGYVLEAENLEPIKGMLVGLYANQADSAFVKQPMLRVSRTDSRGRFVIKGIAKGDYRIYALQDADGNYSFSQQSEKIAFTPQIITPTFKSDIRQDTIWQDSLRISDIKQVGYTHFLPDNITLCAFTEKQTGRYFLKYERKEPNNFKLFFSYGHPDLPRLRGLNFNAKDAFITETSQNLDTLTYWLRDSILIKQDTLRMEMTYENTDTLGNLKQQVDTLELVAQTSYEKRMKAQHEELKKWQKEQTKNKEHGRPFATTYPAEALEATYHVRSEMSPNEVPYIDFPAPLSVSDTAKIHLYEKIDTLWYRAQYRLGKDPVVARRYKFISDWTPEHEYSLEIDSAAFVDIYGRVSKKYKQGIKIRPLSDYGTLTIHLQGMEGKNIIYQLLNESDQVKEKVFSKTGVGAFQYIEPDTYYLRVIVDDNDNGQWDTGLYATQQQPEAVYYYPKAIECKAKWDIKETWNPTSLPLYQQKNEKLLKQKADTKQKQQSRNQERAKRLGINYNPKMGLQENLEKSKK